MKNFQSYFYVLFAMLLPSVLLAHGEVDDGHVETAAAPNPESRGGVIAALVVFALLFAGFIWYSKRQNTPKPPETPVSPAPPAA